MDNVFLKPFLVNKNGRIDISDLRLKFGPNDNQMIGSELEVLSEVAGRICYDSFGKGRGSFDWHKHVLEVGHLSVYEHCWMECEDIWIDDEISCYVGKPGIELSTSDDCQLLRFNARFAIEHDRMFGFIGILVLMPNLFRILKELSDQGKLNYPIKHCFERYPEPTVESLKNVIIETYGEGSLGISIATNWTSCFVPCSRACSHELVRHGDHTAISQRSTRYVNECSNDSDIHCLPSAYYTGVSEIDRILQNNLHSCAEHYRLIREYLIKNKDNEALQILLGIGDISTKITNGLARYALPHNLGTELIFSANSKQWEHIIKMRNHPAADREIRELFKLIEELIVS